MLENVQGYIHSVETAGTVDGPGIRYIVFTTGCPLNCVYCHNPDTRKMKSGKLVNSFDILKEIHEYKDYHKATGGGVTISGGEPMVQPEFISSIFAGCKQMNVHTTLDTSGFLNNKLSDEQLANVDLVLLDIKSMLPDIYKKITKVELQPTLDFAKRLEKLGIKVWIRFVLVPGWSDREDNVQALAQFVSSLSNVEMVEVLPFHKMGEDKWKKMSLEYELYDVQEPSQEHTDSIKQIFKDKGLKVR
jgi:pyruvate formate lyase activating enzyme